MATKYAPITHWLDGLSERPLEVTFSQLEQVIGGGLPPAYRRHLAVWYGSSPGTVAKAIHDAGWRARQVDLVGERLRLEPRVGSSQHADLSDGDGTPPVAIAGAVVAAQLPFERLPGGGRQFLGKPKTGDLTARKGYGPPVFREMGHRCAYCGADLTRYEAWLGISVDHVLPQQLRKAGWRPDWLLDLANSVPCCRACNEFTNSYRVLDPPPSSPDDFFDLRNRHFELKRAMAIGAHERERAWHGTNVSAASTVQDLLNSYRDSLAALKARGVIRSTKVVADYAEWLAARGLGLELAGRGAERGYDATDPATGELYQVKARQVVPPYNQPDLRGGGRLEPKPFDFLIGVLLDGDYGVSLAAKIPYDVVSERARRIEYTNGYRFHLGSGVMAIADVVDVTAELRAAAAS